MSVTHTERGLPGPFTGTRLAADRDYRRTATRRPLRRVREEVRDGIAVMAFSAVSSSALAVAIMLLLQLAA